MRNIFDQNINKQNYFLKKKNYISSIESSLTNTHHLDQFLETS